MTNPGTITTAVAVCETSATLATTTWYVPGWSEAVYKPEGEIVPPAGPSRTAQATAVLLDPVTKARNCCVPDAGTLLVDGVTVMETAALARAEDGVWNDTPVRAERYSNKQMRPFERLAPKCAPRISKSTRVGAPSGSLFQKHLPSKELYNRSVHYIIN
jgi:hypothetical protein